MIDRQFFEAFDPQLALKDEIPANDDLTEAALIRKTIKQQNQIAVALAYLLADQPHLARIVLEGMDP